MKTYLVSEEMLQRTLNALEDDEYGDARELLREILASPSAEPKPKNAFQQEEYLIAQRTAYNRSNEGNG